MKNYTKIALIVAFCCIAAGLLLAIPFMDHMGMANISITVPKTVSSETEEKSFPISGEIRSIDIEDISCNVHILPSADGQCRIDYTDNDMLEHRIKSDNANLSIEVEETGDWFNRFVSVQQEEYVIVYLTECALERVCIETISGEIEISPDISIESAELSSISGNILCSAPVLDRLNAASTSGRIEIESASGCLMNIQTTSGDIFLKSLSPAELHASTASADLILRNICVEGTMELNTASGDIELHEVDAHDANLGTVSGDVEGSILTPKNFITSTVSGNIQVEDSYNAKETWAISTVSGDIEIEILQ